MSAMKLHVDVRHLIKHGCQEFILVATFSRLASLHLVNIVMGLFKPHWPSQYPSLLLWALDEVSHPLPAPSPDPLLLPLRFIY